MLIFEHTSSDKVSLGEKIHIELTMYQKVIDKNTYSISIPSLNMYIQTRKKEEIDDLVHTTLISFFKFWKNVQGLPKLYEHMLSLGFDIKNDGDPQTEKNKVTNKTNKRGGEISRINEELECV